jgi:tetratricopeptide (TPR) repeat protein
VTEEKAPEPNTDAAQDTQTPATPPGGVDAPASAETTQPAAEAPTPPPEPLTPDRAEAENRRNDLFIMAAALVVAFLLGSFKITDNELWIHLKSGWQIEQEGVPTEDSFAYTTAGKSWVNLNWLYDWALYQAELIESRASVRRLAADYRKLLEHRQRLPEFDDQGRDVKKPLPEETQRELEQAFAQLDSTAGTDTYQMRVAAERTAEVAQAAGLQLPMATQESEKGIYPALARYTSPGGGSLISLAVPVAVKGFLLAAMAGVFILTRHAGPTRWWAAVVAVVVLLAMGERLTFSPEVLSLLFLAAVFWILHTFQTGRTWAVWLLVPLQALWVNCDGLFPLGIVVVAIVLLGHLAAQVFGSGDSPSTSGNRKALATAFGLSVLATFANPFGLRAWTVALDWTREIFGRVPYAAASLAHLCGSDAQWVGDARSRGNELRVLAPDLTTPFTQGFVFLIRDLSIPSLLTLLLIVAALVSFVLNRRRFQLTRLLVLLVFLGMFLIAFRYMALVAMASGVMLCLNGQEWFLDRFGTETRITRGWLIWSQGGRAATILAMVLVAVAGITGRVGAAAGGEFGFGIQWVKFDLETGHFLRDAPLKGNSLNTVPLQGNLLLWANYPARRVFIDGRVDLHKDGLAEFDAFKKSLRGPVELPPGAPGVPATSKQDVSGDDDETWKQFLDKYNVSHVILNISPLADDVTFLRTYQKLRTSPQWKLVHRDSSSAVFGRTDFPEGHALADDAAWFERSSLDPARLVYKENSPRLPDPPPPVTAPTLIDEIWRTRRIPSSQSLIASHYLNPALNTTNTAGPVFVVPSENCFLAIRHARAGLAKQQRVSPLGYAVLFRAYFYLFNMEMSIVPSAQVNDLRQLELLSALNQFVAANPKNLEAQLQLAFRYAGMQFLDLADRHFEAAIKLMPEDAMLENLMLDGGREARFSKSDIVGFSENLKIEIDRVTYDLQQLSSQLPSPVAQADYLVNRGCPGMAIDKLTETSFMPGGLDVSSRLARLYIRVGQAGDHERGAERELVNMQGAGGMRPGAKKELWAMVKLMQGDYEHARAFFEDSIAETRHALAQDSVLGLTDQIRGGELLKMVFAPATSIEDADRQSSLEFHLGMVQLEAGEPQEAVRHFKKALEVREDIPYRQLIAFYLEKISGEKLEPLPEPPKDETSDAAPAATPAPPAVVPPKPTEKPKDKE